MCVIILEERALSPTVDVPPASFHDAAARLRSFLRAHHRPEAIVWIDGSDLIAVKSQTYVWLRDPSRRWTNAQVRYESGLDRKQGIALMQVCEAPGLSCCRVFVFDGGGFKVDCAEGAPRVIPITSRLYWRWLRLFGRRRDTGADS